MFPAKNEKKLTRCKLFDGMTGRGRNSVPSRHEKNVMGLLVKRSSSALSRHHACLTKTLNLHSAGNLRSTSLYLLDGAQMMYPSCPCRYKDCRHLECGRFQISASGRGSPDCRNSSTGTQIYFYFNQIYFKSSLE